VVQLTNIPRNELRPRWSPDGNEIAFYASSPSDVLSARILVIPADGGPATTVWAGTGTFNSSPVWSPSGLQLAFMSNRTGAARIWVVSRDTVGGAWHDAEQLTNVGCGAPIWAPDGSGVLCDAGKDLLFFSPKGRLLWRRNLVPSAGLLGYGAPAYSRDGRTICLWAAHRDGRWGYWTIPVAGGTPRMVISWDDPQVYVPGVNEPLRPDLGRDRLFLTVAQYDSDIWLARLRW